MRYYCYPFLHVLTMNRSGLKQQETVPAPCSSCTGFNTSTYCTWAESRVELHELRCQNVLCRIYKHLRRVQNIFEGGRIYMPLLLSVSHNQAIIAPKSWLVDAVPSQLQVHIIFKLPCALPHNIRIQQYIQYNLCYWCKNWRRSLHTGLVAQSMCDNDIRYRANCAWVQHYLVTLTTIKYTFKSMRKKPSSGAIDIRTVSNNIYSTTT